MVATLLQLLPYKVERAHVVHLPSWGVNQLLLEHSSLVGGIHLTIPLVGWIQLPSWGVNQLLERSLLVGGFVAFLGLGVSTSSLW